LSKKECIVEKCIPIKNSRMETLGKLASSMSTCQKFPSV